MNNIKAPTNKDIVRIIISSSSGYGPMEEAFKDRLVLTSSSISYESKPEFEVHSEANVPVKWSYKVQSEAFKEHFEIAAEKSMWYLADDSTLMCLDIGPISLTVTYRDKSRESVNVFCPKRYFKDLFDPIKKMIPKCEYLPKCLTDYEDDLPF